jgi:hypothetical protein
VSYYATEKLEILEKISGNGVLGLKNTENRLK